MIVKRIWKSRGKWNWRLYTQDCTKNSGSVYLAYVVDRGYTNSEEQAEIVSTSRLNRIREQDKVDMMIRKRVHIYDVTLYGITKTYIGKEIVNCLELCHPDVEVSHRLTND